MQNLDLYFSLYLAALPMHYTILLYIDEFIVFQELAGLRRRLKRLSFFMSGRNFEANTWVGLISRQNYSGFQSSCISMSRAEVPVT